MDGVEGIDAAQVREDRPALPADIYGEIAGGPCLGACQGDATGVIEPDAPQNRGCPGIQDAQPDPVRPDPRRPLTAAKADALAFCDGPPGAVLPDIQGKSADPVAQLDDLLQCPAVEGDGFREGQGHGGGQILGGVEAVLVGKKQIFRVQVGVAGGGGGDRAQGDQVSAEHFRQIFIPPKDTGGIRFVDQAPAVRGKIQQNGGVPSGGFKPVLHQIFGTADLAVLTFVPEPAGADGGVGLRGDEMASAPFAGVQIGAVFDHNGLRVDGGPAVFARPALLGAHPADVHELGRPQASEDDTLGLKFADDGGPAGPVVAGLRAARTVPPALPDGAVAGHQLRKLGGVNVVVCFLAPGGVVPVPGGEVESRLQAEFPAGIGEFSYHIHPAGAVAHVVGGGFRVPQAEAVVVLGGEDGGGEARFLQNPRPLAAVQGRGREKGGGFGAVAPFPVREGVDGEVEKGGPAPAVPFHVPVMGGGAEGGQAPAGKVDHLAHLVSLLLLPL